jgi:hypothetical protein
VPTKSLTAQTKSNQRQESLLVALLALLAQRCFHFVGALLALLALYWRCWHFIGDVGALLEVLALYWRC